MTIATREDRFKADWPLYLQGVFYEQAKGKLSNVYFKEQGYADPYDKSYFTSWVNYRSKEDWMPGVRSYLLSKFPCSEEITIQSPDRVNLKGIFMPGKIFPGKAIIFCNPRESCMESMGDRYLTLASDIGCSAIIFNQRGIVESEGQTSIEGYVLDAYTMFEYLVHKKGIQPNDMTFYGTSLGGGFASEAAAMVQKKYFLANINLVSERSFSSLKEEISCLSSWVPVIGPLAVKAFFNCSNFSSFESKKATESLTGRICIIYHKDDYVVPYDASLNKAISLYNCKAKDLMRIELLNNDPTIQDSNYHLRPFTYIENEAVKVAIKRILAIPEFGFVYPMIKDRIVLESRLY